MKKDWNEEYGPLGMIDFITQWFNDKFRKVEPDEVVNLTKAVFGDHGGQKLLRYYVDTILMKPPRTFDPYECMAWQGKCALIVDVITLVDAAENPDKYRQEQAKPRHVVGGRI
jgi:hypothetical protein